LRLRIGISDFSMLVCQILQGFSCEKYPAFDSTQLNIFLVAKNGLGVLR
jgi:hypothetical protein